MILSRKSRYGLRALTDMAVSAPSGQMALGSIAQRNEISTQYLEQVFAALRRAGIVKSIKGPQGGYMLSRQPEEITVAQIVQALEGSYHLEAESHVNADVDYSVTASLQQVVIEPVNHSLDEVLRSITLADLKDDYLQHTSQQQTMYYI